MNPYNSESMNTKDFLTITYKLIIKKVQWLQEIETHKKRDKLQLPLLKEKVNIISNIYSALKLIIDGIDYSNPNAKYFADILNDLGIMLSKANIAVSSIEANNQYNAVLAILESFLEWYFKIINNI